MSGASWEPDPLTEGSDQRRLVDELNRVARQNRTPLDKDARSLRRSGWRAALLGGERDLQASWLQQRPLRLVASSCR